MFSLVKLQVITTVFMIVDVLHASCKTSTISMWTYIPILFKRKLVVSSHPQENAYHLRRNYCKNFWNNRASITKNKYALMDPPPPHPLKGF